MSVLRIEGLHSLEGSIKIQGSKNGVLPVMAASLLHNGTTVLEHIPKIQDVFCMLGILNALGAECRLEGERLSIRQPPSLQQRYRRRWPDRCGHP